MGLPSKLLDNFFHFAPITNDRGPSPNTFLSPTEHLVILLIGSRAVSQRVEQPVRECQTIDIRESQNFRNQLFNVRHSGRITHGRRHPGPSIRSSPPTPRALNVWFDWPYLREAGPR